jgi:hypothetical protein
MNGGKQLGLWLALIAQLVVTVGFIFNMRSDIDTNTRELERARMVIHNIDVMQADIKKLAEQLVYIDTNGTAPARQAISRIDRIEEHLRSLDERIIRIESDIRESRKVKYGGSR